MSPLFSQFSSGGGGRVRGLGFGDPLSGSAEAGEAVFTTVQTHTWTIPDGVESVCVVCVGGGGSGDNYYGTGGSGGALAWKNNIAVTAGSTATVVVGQGGAIQPYTGLPSNTGSLKGAAYQGGNSSFTYGGATVLAEGGDAGSDYPASSYGAPEPAASFSGADGGGIGGVSTGSYTSGQPSGWAYNYIGAGGGGAGGYDGAGGNGGSGQGSQIAGFAGSGGGGGGGGGQETNHPQNVGNGGAGGGGVGLYGEGTSGAAGTAHGSNAYGRGGSGGQDGNLSFPSGGSNGGRGGLYGGGGGTSHGSADTGPAGGPGAQGAVRVIWGEGRAFPTTLTSESDSVTVTTY